MRAYPYFLEKPIAAAIPDSMDDKHMMGVLMGGRY
jgi:hypothetical protein